MSLILISNSNCLFQKLYLDSNKKEKEREKNSGMGLYLNLNNLFVSIFNILIVLELICCANSTAATNRSRAKNAHKKDGLKKSSK